MNKSTKINGPIFQIRKISKKNRNKSNPCKNNRKTKINKKDILKSNEDKKNNQIVSYSYLSFPVVKNEEESGYYHLLKKNDVNCEKDMPINDEISQNNQNKESKEKKKSMKDGTLSGVGRNDDDDEDVNLIITSEKNIQNSGPINNDIKVNDTNESPQNKNYPFNFNKINYLIKEESKFEYLNKNKIIIDKKNMKENLEEKQNVDIEEMKGLKDAFDAYAKKEKERIKKSKRDKFDRLKRFAENMEKIELERIKEEEKIELERIKEEEKIKLKGIKEDAEVRAKSVKTEKERKIVKFKEDILKEQEIEFQMIDEYVSKELESIYIKRNKEALNEELRNSIESINNQKNSISLREESENEEPKENEGKKKLNKNNRKAALSKTKLFCYENFC